MCFSCVLVHMTECSHVLNNDQSFIYRFFWGVLFFLKEALISLALSPTAYDKLAERSMARWRRGLIYNHINPLSPSPQALVIATFVQEASRIDSPANTILLRSRMMNHILSCVACAVLH